MSQPTPLDPATVAVLRPAIIQILNNADLSSVSAKKVRAQLAQLPPGSLPSSLDLSASKKQVDDVIRDCFDQISKSMPAPPQPAHNYNGGNSAPPSVGLALPGLGGIRGGHTTSQNSAASVTPKSSQDKSKSASASNGSKAKSEPKPKKKVAKKRAATTEEDDDDEPRKKRAANPNNPFNRPLILSPRLAEVCGGNEMPRHAVVKQLWAYIKSNNLQNESNKRQILCDEKLSTIFGKGVVDSFEMAKLIGSHLSKKEDS